jgi:hypothetical protein
VAAVRDDGTREAASSGSGGPLKIKGGVSAAGITALRVGPAPKERHGGAAGPGQRHVRAGGELRPAEAKVSEVSEAGRALLARRARCGRQPQQRANAKLRSVKEGAGEGRKGGW